MGHEFLILLPIAASRDWYNQDQKPIPNKTNIGSIQIGAHWKM